MAEQPDDTNQTPATFEWITNRTVSLIARFEGWVPNVYKCPAGYWTIGYGHLVSYDKDIRAKDALLLLESQILASELSEDQKDQAIYEINSKRQISLDSGWALLHVDIRRCADISTIVNQEVFKTLTPGQIDSLVSLTFNLGIGAIGQSSVVRLLNEGKLGGEVADWISPWRKANGEVMVGLQKRRLVEAMIFLGFALDPNSDASPSSQWNVGAMKYTDENWAAIRCADKANGWGLLKDAVRIFREYMALNEAV